MSDILSNYFNSLSQLKLKSLRKSKQNSTLSHDLSEYGLSLSENNILTFTPQKSFSTISKKNIKLNNKKNNENIKIEINEEIPISPKKDINIKYQNIINNNKLKLKNILNKKIFLPKKIIFKEKSKYLQNNTNNINIKNNLNIPKIKKIKNEEEEKKINLYIDDLLKNKLNKNQIFKKNSFEGLLNTKKQSSINPMKYIQMNLSEDPYTPNIYKSYKLQVKLIGNEKYRNLLLDDINYYNNHYFKYKNLKAHIVYSDKDDENKKEINKNIKEMIKDRNKSKLLFNIYKNNFKRKKKLFRNYNSFSLENKLPENKRIDNLNLRLNSVKKNYIDKINKYIENNRNFLSFDQKLNLLLLGIKKTSKYIKKRTEEYEKINKIIFESTM